MITDRVALPHSFIKQKHTPIQGRHTGVSTKFADYLSRTQGLRGIDNGADDRCSRREPDEYALLGLAWVSADRNGPDVDADERLPFGALAES
jgi:hypothetical protein